MHDHLVVRASMISYFGLFAAGSVATYFLHGLVTAKLIALSLLLGPVHVGAMWAGGKMFHLATPATYRRVAYVTILASAILAMPLLDRFVR
jgi:hypothetical protein